MYSSNYRIVFHKSISFFFPPVGVAKLVIWRLTTNYHISYQHFCFRDSHLLGSYGRGGGAEVRIRRVTCPSRQSQIRLVRRDQKREEGLHSQSQPKEAGEKNQGGEGDM